MRIAVLGDIHGNHLALAAVLASAKEQSVEQYWITGDLIGYYFWPGEVLAMLAEQNCVVIRGNHEDMLRKTRQTPDYLASVDSRYGSGVRIALETLNAQQLDWLEQLPHPLELEVDGQRILLAHGTPWDVDEYLYPDADEQALERCSENGHDWVVLGHTHYPMLRRAGDTQILNPGSVGQPRDRQPGAHWALLDLASGSCEFKTESYDYALIAEQARARHPELPYLGDVLGRTA